MSRPPLEGVVVLDFSRILAGPYCTMVLGDLGAEVLKLEPPQGDDSRGWGPPFVEGESVYYLAVNRNKRSVRVNLKLEAGLELVERLAQNADVIVENFRPGTMERLGLGYEKLSAANPRLVYCSISGYGQDGPMRDRPGYDAVMQGEAGWMGLTGEPDGMPMKVGASLADLVTGMMASQGILAALYRRESSGRGEHVDVSLFDSVLSTLCYQAQGYLMTGELPRRLGNRHSSLAPYETFETSDGHVIVGVGNDELWRRFVAAVKEPRLESEEFQRNAQRVENYGALEEILRPLFRGRATTDWVELLERHAIPVGRVRSVAEAFDSPQIDARGMRLVVEHPLIGSMPVTGNPIKLRTSEASEPKPPPTLGEHTESVLRERLGLDEDALRSLRSEGVFGPPDDPE